jgi:stage VI sporulation protein D
MLWKRVNLEEVKGGFWVTEQQAGLRFDIYERVNLPEGLMGIRELDEIELVPYIQVIAEGDQAILKGNLWLTGKYSGDADESSRTLEHSIPVEITLPMNRVTRLEDIAVEIENFDVDLLSARSLNVTGVLSLHGVEMMGNRQDSWQEEEEVVFIHQAEDDRVFEEDAVLGEEVVPEEENNLTVPNKLIENVSEHEESIQFAPIVNVIPSSAETVADEVLFAEEKNDMKVAITGKPPMEPKQRTPLHSLLHMAESKSDVGRQEGVNEALSKTENSRGDELEWKKLFINERNAEQRFKKVKMCIVQRAETIELIAERYRINPREIVLLNRLNNQQVAEGQVIYIPQSG